MKIELERLLAGALKSLEGTLLPAPVDATVATVERARDAAHGDFASNVAMRLAKAARRNPRELAQAIVAALPANALIVKAEVAGAGFINFFLAKDLYFRELVRAHELGAAYGRATPARRPKVLLEFVSANPTGPMHVGHGRQAAYGAALASLLEAAGNEVFREYYINDAGRQMEILAVSVWVRYLEACGETLPFPQNGYRGDYVLPVAAKLHAQAGETLRRPAAQVLAGLPPDAPAGDKEYHIDALISRAHELLGTQAWRQVLELGLAEMLAEIRDDLEGFGVRFDRWTSEKAFADSGAIDRALERLREQGRLYVADSSVFPSNTGVNPQVAIMAIATLCGRHIAGEQLRFSTNGNPQ